MKECEYCEYKGGNMLCEICEAGSMMPDRQEEIHEKRDQNPDRE
jgi:hypothetical protein